MNKVNYLFLNILVSSVEQLPLRYVALSWCVPCPHTWPSTQVPALSCKLLKTRLLLLSTEQRWRKAGLLLVRHTKQIKQPDDQEEYQVKRPRNIQPAVLWQVFMEIVPPLPVWGISVLGCLASQWGQYTEYSQFGTSKEPRYNGEEPPWQVYSHSPLYLLQFRQRKDAISWTWAACKPRLGARVVPTALEMRWGGWA